ALNAGEMLLRDLIDLEATYGADMANEETAEEEDTDAGSADDEEGETPTVTLSAKEEQVRPQVMEALDRIAAIDAEITRLAGADNQRVKALRREMADAMQSIRFNVRRINEAVQRLYDLNRTVVGLDGQMLRLATAAGVTREAFLESYLGHETDADWPIHMGT